MKLRLVLFSSCAVLFSSLSSNAQQEREARLWLTTPDRVAVVAPQATALHFSPEAGELPVLTVDDTQHFQIMDGLWLCADGRKRAVAHAHGRCATGGSAEGPFYEER